MKICFELFSGNADITKRLNQIPGIKCYSLDYEPKYKADIIDDIQNWTYKKLKDQYGKPIFIWASPDCTTYSNAQHGLHRKANGFKSDYAILCDKINIHLWENILKPAIEDNVKIIVENPRAKYQFQKFIPGNIFQRTVFYSTYGMKYEKPTDLFFNDFELNSFINFKHTKATASFQNSHGFLNRCKMPGGLIEDIAKYVENIT